MNVSSTFQGLVHKILDNIQVAKAFIDDVIYVIIFSCSWEEHHDHLNIALDRMLAIGLKLKLQKCIFAAAASRLKCLGSVVSEAGVHPDPEKVVTMQDMPAPQGVPGSDASWEILYRSCPTLVVLVVIIVWLVWPCPEFCTPSKRPCKDLVHLAGMSSVGESSTTICYLAKRFPCFLWQVRQVHGYTGK